MIAKRIRVIILATVVFVFSSSANAQTITIAPAISSSECNAAVASLNAGQHTGAWEFIGSCGQTGKTALVNALGAMRLETDSIYLKKLVAVGSSIRDPGVLAAAQQVASDNAATIPARMTGLLVLIGQYDSAVGLPMRYSWLQFTTVPSGPGCRIRRMEDADYTQAAPMPSGFVGSIAATVEQIAGNTQTPKVVRDFSGCLRSLLANQIPQTVSPSSIATTYLCANKFRVTNSGSIPASGTYQVENTIERGDVAIPSNGSVQIVTIATGAITIAFPGFTTVPVANAGISCG